MIVSRSNSVSTERCPLTIVMAGRWQCEVVENNKNNVTGLCFCHEIPRMANLRAKVRLDLHRHGIVHLAALSNRIRSRVCTRPIHDGALIHEQDKARCFAR